MADREPASRSVDDAGHLSALTQAPLDDLLHRLSVQRQIETFTLGGLVDAKPEHHPEHEQNDQARHRVIDEDDGDTDALVEELPDIALQHARGPAILLDRENPGQ